jgi:hypothetical protein
MTDLSDALGDLRSLYTTYLYFARPEQADAVALWTGYTHFFGRGQPFSFVPYALVTSAERQSGKSTLMELTAMLAHAPLDGQDMSAALIARRCGGRTLLLDEIDGVYSSRDAGDDSRASELRTVLNAGFKYDGKYHRLDRKNLEPVEWSVYGPKMLAGNGRGVPDTVQDRSIAIRMERMASAVKLPKLRQRLVRPGADALRGKLAELASDVSLEFVADFPDALDGRRQDIWEPLFALAHAARGEWPDRAWDASIALTKAEPVISLGMQLLSDVRDVFEEEGDPEMLPTGDLIGRPEDPRQGSPATGLCALEESPWATLTRGRPITPYKVSLLLGEFDIHPERASRGGHAYGPKGYWRARFEKAWAIYLVTPDTSDSPRTEAVTSERPTNANGKRPPESLSSTLGLSGVSDVSNPRQEHSDPPEGHGFGQPDLQRMLWPSTDVSPPVHVKHCVDYAAHQRHHRREGQDFICDVCSGASS